MTQNRMKKKRITFEFRCEPGANVFLAGSFNNWAPTTTPMKESKEKGVYRTSLSLPFGRHEYKFVVNGNWYADPANDDWTPNPYGTVNSVINVA